MVSFPHLRVLDASAGSGKTHQLALRTIGLFLSEGIERVLAITFTNDATREMKHRILTMLKMAALEDEKSPDDEKITGEILTGNSSEFLSGFTAQKLKVKASEMLEHIFQNYLDFKVSTIDSFINSICSSSALEIKFPPRYEIIMNPGPYIEYVIDLALSRISSEEIPEAKVFIDFIESYLYIEQEKRWNPKEAILDTINDLRNEELVTGAKLIVSQEGFRNKEEVMEKRNKIIEVLGKESLETKDKNAITAIKRTINEKDFLNTNLANHVKKLNTRTQKLLDEYFYAVAVSKYNEYIRILRHIENDLEEVKTRESIAFVDELNFRINEYMNKKDVVPEVYFMLGERICHYLVDEFQDTSNIQWQNMRPLVENSLSQEGSLFYVGDKKQAVYRFRGGSVQLFDRTMQDFPSVVDVRSIKLKGNFRSRQNIVEFNNEIFSRKNLEKITMDEDVLTTYSECEQEVSRKKNPEGGYINVKKIGARKRDDLYKAIKSEILPQLRFIIERYGLGDIAFLVMTNEEVENLTSWLTGEGFPVASEVTMDIRENFLTQEIVNFLSFLNSPIDNLSFSAFLCGKSFLQTSGLSREEVFEFLQNCKNGKSPYLYVLFRKNYKKIWEDCFEQFFKKAGFLPPYDLLSEFLKVYGIFKKFSPYEGFVMRLLEILSIREKLGENSLQSFLEYWEKAEKEDKNFKVILPAYPDAIKVSTIFKAKGLDFPVVFLIFNPHVKTENMFIDEKSMAAKYITGKYTSFSNRLREEYEEEKRKEFLDHLNALYVGMTRAEDGLYIFLRTTEKGKSIFGELFEEITVGLPVETDKKLRKKLQEFELPAIREKPISKFDAVPVEIPDWGKKISRAKVDAEIFTDLQRRERIKRGDFIHSVLASMNIIEGDLTGFIRERIKICALREKPDMNIQETEGILMKALSLEQARYWFSLEGNNEKEIETKDGNLIRMDRVIFTKDGIEIIEYKTGEECKESHIKQLKGYIDSVKEIYPASKVKGYLFYIDDCKVVSVE